MIDFNKILDKHLESPLRERVIGEYHCSQLAYCFRKQYFDFTQPKPFSPATLRIFTRGNMIHEFLAKVFSQSNIKVHRAERKIAIPHPSGEFCITGSLDNYIKTEEGEFIVEIKTTRGLERQTEASRHHVMQLTPYMLYKKSAKGIVLYINPSSLQMKWFEVKFEPEIMKEVMLRAELFHEYLTKKEMPPPETRNISTRKWECSYCNYKKECEKIEKGE